MDVLTHFFIPYAAALFVLGLHRAPRDGIVDVARRETRVAYAVVFGLAGFSPDLDAAWSWASHIDGLYFLQHRGVSHTLLFAPVLGLVTTFLLHAAALWRPARFGRFRFRPGFVPVAVSGSYTHLVLDGVTYAGVPALWPFSFARLGMPLFHWIVVALFPFLLVILGLHLWGRLRTPHVAWLGVAVVLALVLLGGVRDHYRPDIPGAEVHPRGSLLEWTVVRPVPGGYEAVLYERGVPVPATRTMFEEDLAPGTEDTVRAVRDTSAFKGFRMGLVGPYVTHSEVDRNGTVRITFTDVAARFEALHDPRWTPTRPHDAWGHVAFEVRDGAVQVVHRGW